MKLELKPFDFHQAVARAGLRPDGTRIAQAAGQAAVQVRNRLLSAYTDIMNMQV